MNLPKYNRSTLCYLIIASLITLLALSLRLHHLDYESLWMDEIHQTSTYTDSFEGIIFSAAAEQQPPLDYWIGHVVQQFSSSDFAVRLPAALFGAGSVALLMFIIAKASTWPVALVAGAIMAMLPFHIYFSQEARPYSLPMFLLLALLLSVRRIARKDDPPGGRHVIIMLIVSVGFLHARALAPLVVVTAMVPIVLLRFALSVRHDDETAKGWQKQLLLASVMLILSVTLYMPSFRLILETGQRYAPDASRLDLGVILDGVSKFSFWPLWRAYIVQMEPLGLALLPLLVIAPILAVKSWKTDFLVFLTALLLPMACVLHLVVFEAKTAWTFRPPYPIYILPLALILTAFTFQRILDLIRPMKKGTILRGVLLVAVGLTIFAVGQRAFALKSVKKKTDWRGLTDYLERSPDDKQALIFDSLKPYGKWEPTFYGFGRYYDGQSLCLSVGSMPPAAQLMAEDTSREPVFILFCPGDYFLTPYSEYPIASPKPPFDDRGIKQNHLLTITDFTGFRVIRLNKTSGILGNDALQIIESLIPTVPSDSSTVELHLAAASLAGALGLQTAEDHLAKAELLAPGQALPRVRAICEWIRSDSKPAKSQH